jgi:hypothetical protein
MARRSRQSHRAGRRAIACIFVIVHERLKRGMVFVGMGVGLRRYAAYPTYETRARFKRPRPILASAHNITQLYKQIKKQALQF